MAKRNSRNAAPLLPVLDDVSSQDEFDLWEFIEEIGPSVAVVEIFEVKKDGSRPHCERVTMDVLREDVYEYLRSSFGPGKYLLQFKGVDRRIQKSKVIEIGGRVNQTAPAAATNGAAAEQHLQFLREQHAAQQTLITTLITGLAQRPIPDVKVPDAAAMLTAVVTAFATLRGDGAKDDSLDKVAKIIGIAKDLQSGEKTPDSWPALIRDVGKDVIQVLRPQQQAALPTAEPVQVEVLPEPEQPARPGSPFPGTPAAIHPENAFDGLIRGALGYLKQKAQLGKDPLIYVDWIFDNPEEPPCAAIRAAVERGATIEQLLQFDPEIAQNPAYVLWFRKFHAATVKAIAEESNSDLDSGGPSGDGSDTGSNESARSPRQPNGGNSGAGAGNPR
jgi:hypothetical protein